MIADCDSEVLCIGKEHVRDLCREHQELLWNMSKVLARRVRQYAELVESLAFRNVDQRVAQQLLILAGNGVPAKPESCPLQLSLTRSEIASRVGSAREAVSRALTRLQELGLIQVDNPRSIRIPNPQALREFSGTQEPDDPRTADLQVSSQMA
jgi:CRP/FNR family transcriptional regulator